MTALSTSTTPRKDRTMLIIETTADLEALPLGAVLLDRNGNPWQKLGLTQPRLWYMAGSREGVDSEKMLMDYAPFRHPTQPAPAGVNDREALVDAVLVAVQESHRPGCDDYDIADHVAGAIVATCDTRTVAQVKAEALREYAAIFEWAVDDEDYAALRQGLIARADYLERGDGR